jgi:hypothetical protein
MESSSPPVVAVVPLELILVSENVPVESHADHVANDGHGVKQMVFSLLVHSYL